MVTNPVDATRLGLGSVQWGQRYGIANTAGQPSSGEVSAMIALAGEAGVRTIDTARDYAASEELIGTLVPREGWRIVTKLTAQLPVSSPEDAVIATTASVQASLEALRTERLDTLLVHRIEHLSSWGGAVWRVLVELRDAGRIRRLGVSALGPEQAWAALEHPEVDVIQVASSLLDQRLFRGGYFEAAAARGKEVFVRSVFLQGVAHLQLDQLPPGLVTLGESLTRIRELAATQEWPAFAPFLYFAYGIPGARVVIGAETAGQVRACLYEWSMARDRHPDVRELAEAIPMLPDAVLNPWEW